MTITDDLVAATARQEALLNARSEEGAAPPLERDMMRVELHRLQADRMLQAGHAEHALIELKRLLGLGANASITLREDLEQLVQRETAQPVPEAESSAGRPDIAEGTSAHAPR